MLSNSGPDLPQKSLQIKSFSRLVSKESPNMASPSFRVLYYGGVSGSVPFLWESQPGTPKHSFSDTYALPPLTPPPSFFNNCKKPTKYTRSKLLHTLFLRINLKKTTHVPQSPSSSSSSSSSSNSQGRSQFSSSSSSFDDSVDGEEVSINGTLPTSTLCFGIGNRAMLAMVRRGSG